ncbi:MAG: LysM peptidoglycan-binding domain-containing protein [Pseudomonas sp.]|uniref:lytic transglycosylase domain-containing protein n=1 Tax=Pseudomonas sp. TaxID=306 RepID=UPI003391BC69
MSPAAYTSRAQDRLARCARLLGVLLAASLAGCQSTAPVQVQAPSQDTDVAIGLQNPSHWMTEIPAEPSPPQDIWERVREGFDLQDEIGMNPRIERQRLWFASKPDFLQKCSERSGLYIHYIVERLEERGMPMELALLPMIESSYNPFAYSRSDAVGLWQFIPSTGLHFNLRQTNWYDGRRDITASTTAAISYLGKLHDMFNGDWLLALAAYNAGEGTVSRAIERNQKLGLPTDYWNLPLPKETQEYVPKLLALSQMVMAPEAYGVSLSPIADEPYFETVQIRQGMNLSSIAAMAQLDEDELYLLNPAFKQRITRDGPQMLLIPTDKADLLTANMLLMKPEEQVDWQQYRVRTGDSLNSIANRYHLTATTLKDVNRLPHNKLSVGQVLNIPVQPGFTPSQPLFQIHASEPAPSYKVKSGDNLWQIAKAHDIEVKDLQRWNGLAGKNLTVGQRLVVRAAGAGAPVSAANAGRSAVTYYKVQKGDSLYLIAKRFKVEVDHLQRWNPSSGRDLKPGQTLTLRLP